MSLRVRTVWLFLAVVVGGLGLPSSATAFQDRGTDSIEWDLSKIVAVGIVQNISSTFDSKTGRIASEVELKIATIEKGSVSVPNLRFVSYGGQAGDLVQFADGYPQFQVGESVRVFLVDSPESSLVVLGGVGLKSKELVSASTSGAALSVGSSALGYSFSGRWWTTSSVGYYINQAGTLDITPGPNDEFTGINQASWNWWIDPGAYMTFPYWGTTTALPANHNDNLNVVGWTTGIPPGGAYAEATCRLNPITNNLYECEIEINDNYLWGMNGESDRVDVTNIITHEFGHWLDLNDLYNDHDSMQTMYAYSAFGQTSKRTLEWGDAMGIRFIYYYLRTAFNVGDVSQGADVDADYFGGSANAYDLLFAWVDNPSGENYIRYRIGYDIDWQTGNLGGTYSPVQNKPGWVGSETADMGVAHAQINGAGATDVLLFWIDNPSGENAKRYQIGWNINSNGYTGSWSSIIAVPGWTGSVTSGSSATIANIDSDNIPDLLLVWVDVPSSAGQMYYQIGWDLSASGTAGSWSNPIAMPWGIAWAGTGAGLRLADIDMNGVLDFVVSYSSPNTYRYRLGWDISTSGTVSVWSREFTVGWNSFGGVQGSGIAVVNIGYSNPNAREIVVASIKDNWPGGDIVQYQWT